MELLGQKVTLKPAEMKDRRLIFDMGMKSEILNFLGAFNNSYEKFAEDYDERYFGGEFNKICGGVVICIEKMPIGFISYGQICFGVSGLKEGAMELDIWMDGENKCGKGYGSDAIITLSDFLHNKFNISTFFMVPSKKNPRAVKSYEKSGFVKILSYEKQKVLEKIFKMDYLHSLDKGSDYLSDDSWFMVKNYT